MSNSKQCLECGKVIVGRSDKKFCDHYCRSNFHNHTNGDFRNVIRNVHYSLKKNRNILLKLASDGVVDIEKELLDFEGFDFSYVTGCKTDKHGRTVYLVYDMAYCVLHEGCYNLYQLKR